ncbi:MAG: hypothetical protein IKY18_02960 [Oscillospiraceae bacterium]|nr:hypothetical protein [Oscillospiraceae bacterium]
MLFRKKITPACAYCQWGTTMDETQILCIKKGVVLAGSKCRKFRYDPCKRIPPKMKPLDTKKYDEVDFSL